jgi:hypothetical protein
LVFKVRRQQFAETSGDYVLYARVERCQGRDGECGCEGITVSAFVSAVRRWVARLAGQVGSARAARLGHLLTSFVGVGSEPIVSPVRGTSCKYVQTVQTVRHGSGFGFLVGDAD